MLGLLAALAAAQPSPAVLIIVTKDGYQFASFSSIERCEAARKVIIADREARNAEWDRRGYKIVVPATFSARCVPG